MKRQGRGGGGDGDGSRKKGNQVIMMCRVKTSKSTFNVNVRH